MLVFKYDQTTAELVVIYSSSTDWTVNGVKTATPPAVVAEQIAMMAATTFR